MHSLILAAEDVAKSAGVHPGDKFMTLALGLLAVALLITAIATVIVTPGRDHH